MTAFGDFQPPSRVTLYDRIGALAAEPSQTGVRLHLLILVSCVGDGVYLSLPDKTCRLEDCDRGNATEYFKR